MRKKQWIWQSKKYPKFVYDKEKINTLLLNSVIKEQGVLEGLVRHLPKEESGELLFNNLLEEIINSFSIEGEYLERSSVRSSLKKQLEKAEHIPTDKHTDRIVSIQLDITKNRNILTKKRLHFWHRELMEGSSYGAKAGEFRDFDDMYVISGEGMQRRVHYVAVPAGRIEPEIEQFLDYCNNSNEHPIIKSAIAHIRFVQIHPYEDGNGRIARNIVNYILSKELQLDSRFFSISYAINRNLKDYGEILEKTNRLSKNPDLDLTEWIEWHSKMLLKAIKFSIETIDKTLKKTKFYDRIRDIKLKKEQKIAIDFLINSSDTVITNRLYRTITSTTQLTASRHLSDLLKKGVLKKLNKNGRSSAYELDLT